jgi:hypothetical protein
METPKLVPRQVFSINEESMLYINAQRSYPYRKRFHQITTRVIGNGDDTGSIYLCVCSITDFQHQRYVGGRLFHSLHVDYKAGSHTPGGSYTIEGFLAKLDKHPNTQRVALQMYKKAMRMYSVMRNDLI